MNRMLSLGVLGLALVFGGGSLAYAGEQPSSPTDSQDKEKKGGHVVQSDPKDEKKDDKGGK